MRECGILLPISSLPSRYGIGAFSREAYEFADKLKEAGQQYWQILPLGPTGYGDSPYQSFSSFAGNPYYIDLEKLTESGFLTEQECDEADFGSDEQFVDYGAIYNSRFQLLRIAYERWKEKLKKEKKDPEKLADEGLFQETKDYCFYAAIKHHFKGRSWSQWDDDIRLRKPEAIEHYKELLADDILFYEFQQLMFEQQWKELKEYAHKQGISFIGDVPIYVSFDGADTWSHPELFQFNAKGELAAVAGCPPDPFAESGQLWGNPLYRWDYHKKTGYAWWMRRMEYCYHLYDMVRLDHFRGFDEYYSIPAEDKTAVNGVWKKGPGMSLFKKIKETFEEPKIIAEDLGTLTPSVLKLLEHTGYPGMKVLEFAFNCWERNFYLPMFYPKNCVVYTGTHDNDPLQGWFAGLSEADRNFARAYMHAEDVPQEEIHWEFIRLALASVAELAIIPMQDYLGLGSEARLNTPSRLGSNWRWRMKKGEFTPEIIAKCRELSQLYGRG